MNKRYETDPKKNFAVWTFQVAKEIQNDVYAGIWFLDFCETLEQAEESAKKFANENKDILKCSISSMGDMHLICGPNHKMENVKITEAATNKLNISRSRAVHEAKVKAMTEEAERRKRIATEEEEMEDPWSQLSYVNLKVKQMAQKNMVGEMEAKIKQMQESIDQAQEPMRKTEERLKEAYEKNPHYEDAWLEMAKDSVTFENIMNIIQGKDN